MKRLRAEVRQQKSARTNSPIGRPKTGATDVIRPHYSEFFRCTLRTTCKWTEIAAALAAQGVTQGNGKPITGRRLETLMRNIRLQNEKEAKKTAVREQRKDAATHNAEREDDKTIKLKLAPELTQRTRPEQHAVISEADIRRNALARHAHLLNKK